MRIFIGIPSYSWQVQIGTMRSLLGDLLALDKRGDKFEIFDEAGNTEIGLAREVIVTKFLESDCDRLVFVDDDVCWQKGALLKLVDHGVEVVGGAYPKRVDPLEWPVKWLQHRADLVAVNGLLEVEALPGGFVRMSRSCLERMHDEFGPTMFDNIRRAGGRDSEDISFCRRWRSIGGKVWLDPEIRMGHVGYKMFDGHIGDWLRAR